ncbi:MAG: hypothetical protein NTY65_17285 [Planctomycetota bacterium]|nr:hypothetical protein [Planctomycetota bacterium]
MGKRPENPYPNAIRDATPIFPGGCSGPVCWSTEIRNSGDNTDILSALSFAPMSTQLKFSRSPEKAGSFTLAARGLRGQGNKARQVRQWFTGGDGDQRQFKVSGSKFKVNGHGKTVPKPARQA